MLQAVGNQRLSRPSHELQAEDLSRWKGFSQWLIILGGDWIWSNFRLPIWTLSVEDASITERPQFCPEILRLPYRNERRPWMFTWMASACENNEKGIWRPATGMISCFCFSANIGMSSSKATCKTEKPACWRGYKGRVDTDECRGHNAKWNKPDTDRQISHDLIYMWNLKKCETQSNEESNGGNQRLRGGEKEKIFIKARTFSYLMNTIRGSKTHHGDHSWLCAVYVKSAKKVHFKVFSFHTQSKSLVGRDEDVSLRVVIIWQCTHLSEHRIGHFNGYNFVRSKLKHWIAKKNYIGKVLTLPCTSLSHRDRKKSSNKGMWTTHSNAASVGNVA